MTKHTDNEKVTPVSHRKDEHIRINLEKDVRSQLTNGLEKYHLIHRALPEINLEDVHLSLSVFGRALSMPLLISSMTGGAMGSSFINQHLAEAAQQLKIAMGVGSQRAAIEDIHQEVTFKVRKYAPNILLFANLGAVQLNYGYDISHCLRAVDMIEADGLILHLNALQEAVQPEGNTRFAGLLHKIEQVCRQLPVPVVVKEVGWGITEKDARHLAAAGVAAIDVAGAGGTSWSQVEMHRARNEQQARLAATFKDWGIPTAEAILNVRRAAPDLTVFASGGLRNGVDVVKCIALGATLGGMAAPFLKAASVSTEEVISLGEELYRQIQVCMFATGTAELSQLADKVSFITP